MTANGLKTLHDTLKRQSFDGAYYIYGEDDFQKEDALQQLVDAAVEPGSLRDFNMEVLRAQETGSKALDAALSAVPMMADRRIVVIRDAGSLKKDARKVLDQYLANPSPDVLVLLMEAVGGKTDKGLARTATPLEFDSLSANRIPRWITHYASTNLGLKLSQEAIELLQAAVGTDLRQLVTELDKLASYAGGRQVEEADVTAVVGVRRGETMADFLDVVAARDASRSMELLPHILSQPKTSAVQLVMALTVQTLALAWGKARRAEGLPRGRLQSEYFNLLKQSGSVFTGRPWGSAASSWAGSVDTWSNPSLDRALISLLAADTTLKETRVSSEDQVVANLILSMCVDDDGIMAA